MDGERGLRSVFSALDRATVAVARREMEDAAFRRDRLQTAVERLRDRLKELRYQEEDQRRQVAYDKVKAERDALAEELARVYRPLAAQLGELLPRVAANDRQVQFVNNALPSGSGRLLVAELVARGLRGFVENSVEVPSIVSSLRLPAFERCVNEPFAWPRLR